MVAEDWKEVAAAARAGAGADILEQGRAGRRAVGRPELRAMDAVVGRKDEAVADPVVRKETPRSMERLRGCEVVQPLGASGRPIRRPQLLAGLAVVRREQEPVAERRDINVPIGGFRTGDEAGQRRRAPRGAVALPELDAVRRRR